MIRQPCCVRILDEGHGATEAQAFSWNHYPFYKNRGAKHAFDAVTRVSWNLAVSQTAQGGHHSAPVPSSSEHPVNLAFSCSHDLPCTILLFHFSRCKSLFEGNMIAEQACSPSRIECFMYSHQCHGESHPKK